MSYQVGDAVRLTVEFTDADGVATDPTTVELGIMAPSGAVTTQTDTAGLTRESAGKFHYDLLIDEAGTWAWRWVGTGAVQQAEQGSFYAERKNIKD